MSDLLRRSVRISQKQTQDIPETPPPGLRYLKNQGIVFKSSPVPKLALIVQDVPETSESILINLLEEENQLIYSLGQQMTVSLDDILKTIQLQATGNFFKITQRVMISINQLFESENEDEGSEVEIPVKRKERADKGRNEGRKQRKESNGTKKNTTSAKSEKVSKQNEYKKGTFNPLVKETRINQILADPSDFGDFDTSWRISNLNFHRAALSKNNHLLDNLLKSEYKITNLMEPWGPDCTITSLERAFFCENEYFVREMYKILGSSAFLKAIEPRNELNYVSTGEVSVQAYGVKTRKVQVSRGGREGNNALLWRSSSAVHLNSYISQSFLKNLIENSVSINMLKFLITLYPLVENTIGLLIGSAVRSGNQELSLFLISHFNKQGSFGFNFLHEQVLGESPLSAFKSPSITKKPIENYLVAPLHVACINKDAGHLSTLLASCDDLNYADQEGRKAVHYAAASVSSDCLQLLKSHGCNLHEPDQAKITPLMIAARYNRDRAAEFLTQQLVPLHFKAKDGRAAIHFAAEYGALAAFKVLIRAGCKVDQPGTDRKTPLMFAATKGHFDVVLEILNLRAKDTKKDKCRRSALIWAVKNGHSDVVSLLLARGSPFDQPDSSKNFPLHYAAAYGWLDCLKLLIQAGADVNVLNEWNISPLLISSLNSHDGCFRFLLQSTDADVNIKDEKGRTLVSRAVIELDLATFDQLDYLVSVKKADVNIQDLSGFSPLHHLCQKTLSVLWKPNQNNGVQEDLQNQVKDLMIRAANLLLDHGSDINASCKAGVTPVMKCIQLKNVVLAELLIKKGADLTICPEPGGVFHYLLASELPLFILCARLVEDQIDVNAKNAQGRTLISKMIDFLNEEVFEIIQNFLLAKKADVKLVDYNGLTPLHHLCRLNKVLPVPQGATEAQKAEIKAKHQGIMKETAKLLISSGFDFNTLDSSGSPAILYAIQMNQIHLVELLVELGADLKIFPNGGGIFHYLASFDLDVLSFCEKLLQSLTDGKSLQELDKEGFSPFLKFVEFYSNNFHRHHSQASFDFQKKQVFFIQVLRQMIAKGADPHAEVSKLFSFRDNPSDCGTVSDCKDSERLIKKHEYGYKGKFCALHLFASCSDPVFFEFLLGVNLDLNHQDLHRSSVIMKFYNAGSAFTEKLIQLGVDLNTQDDYRVTLAHYAVERLDVKMLQLLLEKGVNVNTRGKLGKTILSLAVERKNFQVVRMILDHQADPNVPDDQGLTPLHSAFLTADSSADASFDMESLLLLFKADINAKDLKGRTPLHYCFLKLIKAQENLLLDPIEAVSSACCLKEIDVNVQDYLKRTPLHYAASRGLTTSTMFLISKGADLEVEDFQGNTPLAIAIKEGHANYAIMLVQQSAKVTKNIFMQTYQKAFNSFHPDDNYLNSSCSRLPEGHHSMFKASIMQNFLGLAYLLLFNGYPYMLAMQDAMTQSKFPLVKTLLAKVSENSELQKSNENCQNLFHSLAQFSNSADKDLMFQICHQLIDRGVDFHQLDSFHRNPLHYSTIAGNLEFSRILLARDVSFTAVDCDGMNPIAYAVQGCKVQSSLASLQLFAAFGAKFQFKYKEGGVLVSPLLHAVTSNAPVDVIRLMLGHGASLTDTGSDLNLIVHAIQGSKICSSLELLQVFASFHCEFCCRFSENGVVVSPLVHAVKSNAPIEVIRFLLARGASVMEKDSLGTSAFIYSVHSRNHARVKALTEAENLDLSDVDNQGKTALMYAVLNNDLAIVKTILNAKSFKADDLKVTDPEGRHVLHYIVQPFPYGSFENKQMLELVLPLHPQPLLRDKKGEDIWTLAKNQRSGVLLKVISQHFSTPFEPVTERKLSLYEEVSDPVDYLQDAEEYVRHQRDVQQFQLIPREPDRNGEFPAYYQVLEDYDLVMTKVDLSSGPYSTFVFYRIQALLDSNRSVYVLYTRWGRIGEVGASQRTPFSEKEEIIQEFRKIFKAKTGNEWGKPFEKQKGKYFPTKLEKTQTSYRDFICPFEDSQSFEVSVAPEVIQAVQDFTSQKLFRSYFNSMSINLQLMNFSNLSRSSILQAENILIELSKKIKEFQTEQDIDRKLELIVNLQEMTSRFYELIPVYLDPNSPISPILKLEELDAHLDKVLVLKDLEIASKIILAALYRQKEINPYLYVLKSLQVDFQVLGKNSDEFKLIQKYMRQGRGNAQVSAIFKVNRKGEAERIQEFKDVTHRKLLWHGTRTMNLISILAKGLKIAPPEAPKTGYMFGKGVYFADTFSKSLAYCGASYSEPCFMLLCEVVLGNMYQLNFAQYIESLPDGFLSTKGLGYQCPDPEQSITTTYGVEVPIGDLKPSGSGCNLSYNEFIVYNTSQIRIRYLLHLKNI